jgi:hypothetical protein
VAARREAVWRQPQTDVAGLTSMGRPAPPVGGYPSACASAQSQTRGLDSPDDCIDSRTDTLSGRHRRARDPASLEELYRQTGYARL